MINLGRTRLSRGHRVALLAFVLYCMFLGLLSMLGVPMLSADIRPIVYVVPDEHFIESIEPVRLGAPGFIESAINTNHLDPLVAVKMEDFPFYPSRASTAGKKLELSMFESAELCGACHQEIFSEWKDSVMANSWDDPIYRALLKRASTATEGKVDKLCIGCHSPMGLTTNSISAHGEDEQHISGIGCDDCHSMSGSSGVGNGSYILEPKKNGRPLKFGPRKDAVSPYHDTSYSELHTKSEFCATCHNVTHPFNRMPVERTYDEWRDSPYAGAGTTCQDCHMKTRPGKSAAMGKERKDIFSHRFTGANVTLHTHFGQDEMAEAAREMLRSAAEMEFSSIPIMAKVGQQLQVAVKVSNTGAGHKLPTGFPEGREVWIDFSVVDAEGKTIYSLGSVKNGHTEKGTKSFKAILGDDEGNVIDLEVWNASRVLSDTRILPMGYAEELFSFKVPAHVAWPLRVRAELKYWSFPQSIIDELLGPGELVVPITKMAAIEREIVSWLPNVEQASLGLNSSTH